MAGPVRQQIDQASLERYLEESVPEVKPPIKLKQFGYGQSNPTYQITDSRNHKYVLRKKPPGKLLSKSAHKVDREYRVIHALEKTDVPVPRTFCLCEDDKVIGTTFYIMEFLDGRIIDNAAMPGLREDERREMWHDAVRTLARLHRVRPKDVGLESFGRPSGFYKRQIKTFGGLAESQSATKDADSGESVGQLPHFEDMIKFFSQENRQPVDRGVLFHGDFKIDNLVFHKTEPRVIGILDWEMATIGHPLADLCNLTQGWVISNSTPSWPRIHADEAFLDPRQEGSAAKNHPGLPTREECVRWYEDEVGFKISSLDLEWATAFALFRDSIIFQGIAARYAARQASSESAKRYADERVPFANMAWAKIQDVKKKSGSRVKL